jgi:TetR/AcrR family transcriptional regulator, transcriptional repressor for nem operon
MRRTKEATAESRKIIVTTASRLFREKGFDGIGVADIMAAAGLTHGGFYRHFPSKEALIAEAMQEAFNEKSQPLEDDTGGISRVRAYVSDYLSKEHLAKTSRGCPIAAVGSESQHVGPAATDVFSNGIASLLKPLAKALQHSAGDRHQAALRLLASLVGAVVMARASNDPKLQADLLEAVRNDEDVIKVLGRS